MTKEDLPLESICIEQMIPKEYKQNFRMKQALDQLYKIHHE